MTLLISRVFFKDNSLSKDNFFSIYYFFEFVARKVYTVFRKFLPPNLLDPDIFPSCALAWQFSSFTGLVSVID